MKNISFGVRVVMILALVSAVVLMIAGAGNDRELTIMRAGVRGFVLPRTEVISFDETVAVLDTATGAVYRIKDPRVLDNASARVTFQLRVAPVKEETSGYLELQRPTFNQPNAIFLVDIVTGKTWILRDRASSNRSWEPILLE